MNTLLVLLLIIPSPSRPPAQPTVFEEINGYVEIEAEAYHRQTRTS